MGCRLALEPGEYDELLDGDLAVELFKQLSAERVNATLLRWYDTPETIAARLILQSVLVRNDGWVATVFSWNTQKSLDFFCYTIRIEDFIAFLREHDYVV